ncbi:MAG: hypothetical protein ABJB66_19845 [Gemmatimonadaceae bacterium]
MKYSSLGGNAFSTLARNRSSTLAPGGFSTASLASLLIERRLARTVLTLGLVLSSVPSLSAQTGAPSRKASKGCVWERVSSASNGFSASVQKCDYGDRKIHLFMKDNALMEQYSDAGAKADTVIDIIDLNANETVEAGMQRAFSAHTKPAIAKKCVLTPYKEGKEILGAKRYEFVPNAALARELKKINIKGDIPEPPCGDWGTAPDGIQYFQVFPTNTKRFLFVRVGQDTPMFDERTLQLTVPAEARK